jgi:hypothetical protein
MELRALLQRAWKARSPACCNANVVLMLTAHSYDEGKRQLIGRDRCRDRCRDRWWTIGFAMSCDAGWAGWHGWGEHHVHHLVRHSARQAGRPAACSLSHPACRHLGDMDAPHNHHKSDEDPLSELRAG